MNLETQLARWYVAPFSPFVQPLNLQSTHSSFVFLLKSDPVDDIEEDSGDESVMLRSPQDHQRDFVESEDESECATHEMVCKLFLPLLLVSDALQSTGSSFAGFGEVDDTEEDSGKSAIFRLSQGHSRELSEGELDDETETVRGSVVS